MRERDRVWYPTGIAEFDAILGGGASPGMKVAVTGARGVGKTTLLLQAAAGLARGGRTSLYLSSEMSGEAVSFLQKRANAEHRRVRVVGFASDDIESYISPKPKCDVLFVDSLLTSSSAGSDGDFGSVSQVRAVLARLDEYAKLGMAIFVLVHTRRDGTIMHPKTVRRFADRVVRLSRSVIPVAPKDFRVRLSATGRPSQFMVLEETGFRSAA